MNILYSWNFQVTLGNNNITLPAPVMVYRGNFIVLTQTTGYVALYTAGNASYSDMAWYSSVWNKLVATSNWRFYLSPLTNFSVYQNSFSLFHSYKWIGLYNLSITFLSANETFLQVVNITDCKLLLIHLFRIKIIFYD